MNAYAPALYDTGTADVGPMVTGGDLEDAVEQVLRDWLPAYICECERLHAIPAGSTPYPRGWVHTGRDLQKHPSDQLPCIVIMAGGVIQQPHKKGVPGGIYAFWGLDIGSIFAASQGRESRRRCQLYAAAVRSCLLQRPLTDANNNTLGVVDYRGEVYDELDFSDTREYSASIVSFNVEMFDVAWAAGGPPSPAHAPIDPTQPFEPLIAVEGVDVTVDNIPVTDPLPVVPDQ